MNDDERRALLLEVLGEIAPEADAADVDPSEDLRDELDLDSMDMLNLVTAVEERLGISVPERDYPRMNTLDGAVAYLGERQAAAST